MLLQIVDDENIKDFISGESKKLVMFGATWCGPCKSAKQIVQKIASEKGAGLFAYCDIEETVEFVSTLGIKAIPSFGVFREGKVIQVKTLSREADIRNLVDEFVLNDRAPA